MATKVNVKSRGFINLTLDPKDSVTFCHPKSEYKTRVLGHEMLILLFFYLKMYKGYI